MDRHIEIIALSEQGKHPSSVADEVGCSRALVYKVLHASGRDIPRRDGYPAPMTRSQRTKALSLADRDLTINEISAVTGSSYYQIRRLLRRNSNG